MRVYNVVGFGKDSMNQYLEQIDNDIAAKHLLKHPFYLKWTRGELSKQALADYARQYYYHVAAFPTYLSAVHAKCEDETTRKQLLSNLIDEEAGSPNHPELWLQFAEGLGVSDVEARNTIKEPETINLIDTFRSVCGDRSTAEALAALYAYESQIPAICESKIEGLKKLRFQNLSIINLHRSHRWDREHSAERDACCARRQSKFRTVKDQRTALFAPEMLGSRASRDRRDALFSREF
jgi:pyrroloquinoline-quinone synthase